MHVKAKGRRLLTFACVAAFLLPIMATHYTTAGEWVRPGQWVQSPMFIGKSVCAGLLITGLVWWKAAAAIPEVILVLVGWSLVFNTAGSFVLHVQPAQQVEAQSSALSISSYDGTEVRCNGVLLGKTPLRMTLAEFTERVSPAQEPPVQEAAFDRSASSSSDSVASMNWSAVPFDPLNPETGLLGTTPKGILRRFSTGRYFWEFSIGKYRAATDHVICRRLNNEVILSVTGWETIRRHADALRTLATEESVDPLVAFADHIESHPPLRQHLSRPVPSMPQTPPQSFPYRRRLESFSPEPLRFAEAVMRRDWLWIARSNNPESVPLLKLYLERHRPLSGDDRYLLSHTEHVLAVLMESEQPEIRELVRSIMTSADWTHSDLLEYYIERQLEAGGNREELTSWLAGLREGLSKDFLPLVIRVAGSNFSEVVGPYSDFEWSTCIESTPEFPLVVLDYLAQQWRVAPSAELARGISHLETHPVLYAAIAETDLSDGVQVEASEWFIHASSGWMKQALTEAAAKAFAKASEPSHINALARFLASNPNSVSTAALDAYAGPENKVVAECLQQVRSTLKRRQENLEEQIQLARDLLAGTKTAQDLVSSIRLEWKNGGYVRTPR